MLSRRSQGLTAGMCDAGRHARPPRTPSQEYVFPGMGLGQVTASVTNTVSICVSVNWGERLSAHQQNSFYYFTIILNLYQLLWSLVAFRKNKNIHPMQRDSGKKALYIYLFSKPSVLLAAEVMHVACPPALHS